MLILVIVELPMVLILTPFTAAIHIDIRVPEGFDVATPRRKEHHGGDHEVHEESTPELTHISLEGCPTFLKIRQSIEIHRSLQKKRTFELWNLIGYQVEINYIVRHKLIILYEQTEERVFYLLNGLLKLLNSWC